MNLSRLKGALIPLMGVLAMMSWASAQADSFGRSTIGATPSSGLRADFKRGSKFTLTQPGTLRELCAYLDGQGGGTSSNSSQRYRIVVYRDSGGVPGARVAESSQDAIVGQGDNAGWRCSETEFVPLTSGSYWMVIHTGGGGGSQPNDGNAIIRYYADGTGNWFGNADAFSDGSSVQFGAGGTGNGTLSVYAKFAPESQLRNAGRTTLGTTPSAALRADFKRGSSFTLSEEGRLTSITGYFDGLGATSGFQYVRMALYKDKNGVPDAYVTETEIVVDAGMTPQWMSGYWIDPVTLPAGKYWLILHTSGPPVARYYADGTGNWYGNADTYSDGASNPFGVGGTGNGTVSAFITYEPGPFVSSTIGSQVPGTTAQAPLKANFVQGSPVDVPAENSVLTGLNAYIDGLGGTSGTQRMKLVITDLGLDIVGVTQEVIIPAGMSPQWVHFPMPPVRLPLSSYEVLIYTGGTAGVARIYGKPGSGGEIALTYHPGAYYPPDLLDYELTPNNVSYSFYGDVQLPQN
jgi:hypothetical protein